ncbi:MAG: CRTAC1 family protein, partial [Isosphaeraceae bacterium]
NDTTANYFFRNVGGLKFEEEGIASGSGTGAVGGFQAGMGVACGDLDGDGLPDLAVTNFHGEATSLFRNLGGGAFGEESAALGLASASRSLLGFGVCFLDYDNDGWLDLTSANGHVNDYRPNYPYAMPLQLLKGIGRGRLSDVSRAPGSVWETPRIGRGLVVGDLDNDGRVDLLAVSQDSPLAYLRNRTTGGHFLTLQLEGATSHRDAIGTRVTVTTGGRRRVVQRTGGGSYLSASDPRLHVGLGEAQRVDLVEVAWPSGQVDHHHDLAADAGYLLREGSRQAEPLKGFLKVRP